LICVAELGEASALPEDIVCREREVVDITRLLEPGEFEFVLSLVLDEAKVVLSIDVGGLSGPEICEWVE